MPVATQRSWPKGTFKVFIQTSWVHTSTGRKYGIAFAIHLCMYALCVPVLRLRTRSLPSRARGSVLSALHDLMDDFFPCPSSQKATKPVATSRGRSAGMLSRSIQPSRVQASTGQLYSFQYEVYCCAYISYGLFFWLCVGSGAFVVGRGNVCFVSCVGYLFALVFACGLSLLGRSVEEGLRRDSDVNAQGPSPSLPTLLVRNVEEMFVSLGRKASRPFLCSCTCDHYRPLSFVLKWPTTRNLLLLSLQDNGKGEDATICN